jgi:hypothetical protein
MLSNAKSSRNLRGAQTDAEIAARLGRSRFSLVGLKWVCHDPFPHLAASAFAMIRPGRAVVLT